MAGPKPKRTSGGTAAAPLADQPQAAESAPKPAKQKYFSLSRFQTLARVSLLAVLVIATAGSSQLALSPVYGAHPSARHHLQLVMSSAILGCVSGIYKLIPKGERIKGVIPILSAWTPLFQHLLFVQSKHFGAIYGPVITEAVSIAPTIFLVSYYAASLLKQTRPNARFSQSITLYAGYLLVIFTARQGMANYLAGMVGSIETFSRIKLQLVVAVAYGIALPSIWLPVILVPIFHSIVTNPHFDSARSLEHANQLLGGGVLDPKYFLLDRRESVTGYVSVVEQENNFRVMRCDHSLLGGNFLVTPNRRRNGMTEPETVYAIFTMLESVRLVDGVDLPPDDEASALVVGLGIGTSPRALIKLGIDTTIVEIDPAVHEFAVKYFDLPTNHTAVLEDAIGWVSAEKEKPEVKKYNYIIHDVFTGGVEPSELFTRQFIQNLSDLLNEDGVIAINYASDIDHESTTMVMNTIFSVFPSCRVYRETSPDISEEEQFSNMVAFCIKKQSQPITFRPAVPADYRSNMDRQRFIPPRDSWDITSRFKLSAEELSKLEVPHKKDLDEQALNQTSHHWSIMREAVPDLVWDLW